MILGADSPSTIVHFVGGPWAGKSTTVQGVTGPLFSASHEVGKHYWLDTKSDPPTYRWNDQA